MTMVLNPTPPRSPGLDRRMQAAMKDARALRSQYVVLFARAVWHRVRNSLRTAFSSGPRSGRGIAGPVR